MRPSPKGKSDERRQPDSGDARRSHCACPHGNAPSGGRKSAEPRTDLCGGCRNLAAIGGAQGEADCSGVSTAFTASLSRVDDQERWAFAVRLLAQHGGRVGDVVEERVHHFGRLGDEDALIFWGDIAEKLIQLMGPENGSESN
ncbi:DUF6961 family protein [Sphingomonas colocasiae]|uniref:DUF6961 family protein n=1 Tax=Sphingomonas colocasiae TaxID=1848973 RepID=UPI003CCEA37D